MTRDGRGTLSRHFRSSFPEADQTHFRTLQWADGVADSPESLQPLYPTVLHAFMHTARTAGPYGLTLVPESADAPEEALSYRDVCLEAQHFAGRLLAQGTQPGDRVLIVLPTSFEFVIVFFAVQMIGAIPVPSYPPAMLERAEVALERLTHIARHSGAAALVTNRKLRTLLGEVALHAQTIRDVVTVERLDQDGPREDFIAQATPDDPGFIQYTSGSTGSPKGVLLTHANLVANIHAMGQALQVGRHDVGVSWLPLYHDMGLIGALLFCIYWRLPLVLMSPTTFLMDPGRWLWAIHRHRGTLSPAPNFAYARCVKRLKPADRAGLDLSCWRFALNGAEPVNPGTLDDFVRVFGPHGFKREAILPVYGLAECSLAVSFPKPRTPLTVDRVDRMGLADGQAVPAEGEGTIGIVGVGTAVPGHEVRVVGEQGELLPEREVGHIVVRGPSVMAGYFHDPETTARVLNDGWLWTGDLGYFAQGQLFVTGRVKDLIIVRGRNYYAEDIERVAEQIPGVKGGGVIAFGVYDEQQAVDLVVIVCETSESDAGARERLATGVTEAVQTTVGVQVDEVVLVGPGALPKTSSGKRQRNLCRALYLAGDLADRRTNKMRLALVFARSGLGLAASQARRLLGIRREPP
jgi:acyl-CoA synthetase (AMP-forming)/AMP-acid ligase II